MDITIQQLEAIKLGTSTQKVVELLGQPIHTSDSKDHTIFQYNSRTHRYSHFVYIKDAYVDFLSMSVVDQSDALVEYIEMYGYPEKTIEYVKDFDRDYGFIHIWSTLGITAITPSAHRLSPVVRKQVFTPTTLQGYFSTWGKNLAKNKEATVSATTTGLGTPTSSQSSQLPLIGISLILFVLFIAFFIVWLRFKRKPLPPKPLL